MDRPASLFPLWLEIQNSIIEEKEQGLGRGGGSEREKEGRIRRGEEKRGGRRSRGGEEEGGSSKFQLLEGCKGVGSYSDAKWCFEAKSEHSIKVKRNGVCTTGVITCIDEIKNIYEEGRSRGEGRSGITFALKEKIYQARKGWIKK